MLSFFLQTIKCGTISVGQPVYKVPDNKVLDTATENDLSMVITGIRHFNHQR
jgi:AICAR transformylase/IMP cyclohydrolase PurH